VIQAANHDLAGDYLAQKNLSRSPELRKSLPRAISSRDVGAVLVRVSHQISEGVVDWKSFATSFLFLYKGARRRYFTRFRDQSDFLIHLVCVLKTPTPRPSIAKGWCRRSISSGSKSEFSGSNHTRLPCRLSRFTVTSSSNLATTI